jgi:dihydroxy-acid dehydratase
VELIAQENLFDGIVFTSVCDDVVPAHLMAAARINIPSIILLGGYMAPKMYKGKLRYVQQVATAYGEVQKGDISGEEFEELEDIACGSCGACPVMGTGNTMGAIAETLGMTLPGNATLSGADPTIDHLAYRTGARIVSLVEETVAPLDIMTSRSLENAIRVFLAVGGSTNALLHLPAIAHELEMEIPLGRFDSLSRETPFICNVKPSGAYSMERLDEAGGLPALIKELGPLMYLEEMTITGMTLGENVKDSQVLDREVIFPIGAPIAEEGGIAVLKGSLAPNGAIVKISGLPEEALKKKGPARVFNSEQEACESLLGGNVRPGDMVVIRYVGPKGDPGMRITARFLWLLSGINLEKEVTVLTDGRVSGTNLGGTVCHVSPEAADGGAIALVQDGDIIELDTGKRRLQLKVPDDEIRDRRKLWEPPKTRFKKGLLARISTTMAPVEKGAFLRRNFEERNR